MLTISLSEQDPETERLFARIWRIPSPINPRPQPRWLPQGTDGRRRWQTGRTVGELHPAYAAAGEPHGLDSGLRAGDWLLGATVDRREPARVVRPVDDQVARLPSWATTAVLPSHEVTSAELARGPADGSRLNGGLKPDRLGIGIVTDPGEQGRLSGRDSHPRGRPRVGERRTDNAPASRAGEEESPAT